jgi:hypothetical protein
MRQMFTRREGRMSRSMSESPPYFPYQFSRLSIPCVTQKEVKS